MSEDVKKRISAALLGRKFTPETLKAMSEAT